MDLPTRPSRRTFAALLATAVAGALVVGAPQVASASTNAVIEVNTFTFTGALSGSLHISPKANCKGAGPVGVTLSPSGQLQGSKSTAWVIQVLSLANGTYALHSGSVIGVTISAQSGNQQWGLDQRGTLSVSGSTGAVTAELSGTDGTSVHVTGAWACPAS